MLMAHLNEYDSCALDASAEVTNLPVENTQVNPLKLPHRVTAASVWVDFDRGSSVNWRLFAVLAAGQGNDLTSAATFRLRLSNTATTTGDLHDSGTISAGVITGYPQVYYDIGSNVSARYGRIDLADASLSTIDIGRIFGGPTWEPTRNHSFGRGMSWADDSAKVRSEGGQIIVGAGPRFRVADFALNFNTETEMMANAFEIDRTKGINDDVLVMLDPTGFPQQLSIWGPIIRVTPLALTHNNIVSKRYQVEERL